MNVSEVRLALSIWQPWAYLIPAGIKDCENRNWFTEVTGRILIHASRTYDVKAMDFIRPRVDLGVAAFVSRPYNLALGALIGEVDIVVCRYRRLGTESDKAYSTWHQVGSYGFYFKNPYQYKTPVPCRGKPGFFTPDLSTLQWRCLDELRRSLDED
jgi:hypothetical protein